MNIKIVATMIVLIIVLIIVFRLVFKVVFKVVFRLPLINHQPFNNVWKDTNSEGKQYKYVVEDMLLSVKTCLPGVDIIPIYGSLLGMVRHGTVIPWDDDIDICIPADYVDEMMNHKEELKSKGVGIVKIKGGNPFDNVVYYKFYALAEPLIEGRKYSWPFIDVFTWEEDGDEIIISDISHPYHSIPKSSFLPLKPAAFGNITLSTLNKPRVFLDDVYGKDWESNCVSTTYNHRMERPYKRSYSVKCKDIINADDTLFDNVWVINSLNRPEQWNITRERLESLNISPQRWISLESNSMLSHTYLWQYLYEIGSETAIIIEDDVILPEGITRDTIKDMVNNSKGFNILHIGKCFTKTESESDHMTMVGTSKCLNAYILSKSGIRNLSKIKHQHGKHITQDVHDFCTDSVCFISKYSENS